jgi:hypothetical protein
MATNEVVMMAGPHRKAGRPPAGAAQRLARNMTKAPLVSTVGRASELLRVDPGRLAALVSARGVPEWGRHANGSPVYKWPALVELAAELGATAPASSGPTLRTRQERGRASRYRRPSS